MIKSMGKDTITKLRRQYHSTWNREWPESDSYLLELWLHARASANCPRAKTPTQEVWDNCLNFMRECHPFTPDVASAPAPAPNGAHCGHV